MAPFKRVKQEGGWRRMKVWGRERDHVQFPPLENISWPETPSWVPLARRASFACEPISCVWLAEGRVCICGVCMCVCVRVCASTGGCSSERSGVVLSAQGGKECPNQTQWTGCLEREKERERDKGRKTQRHEEWEDTQWGERWGETGSGHPESSRQKEQTKERSREHQRRIQLGIDSSFAASEDCEQHSSCWYLHSSWVARWSENLSTSCQMENHPPL